MESYITSADVDWAREFLDTHAASMPGDHPDVIRAREILRRNDEINETLRGLFK